MKRYYLIYDGDAQHHATAVEIEIHEGLTHQEDIEQLNKIKERLTALAKDTPRFNLKKLDIIPAEDLIHDIASEHFNDVLDKVFNDMNYVAMPLNLLVDKIANEIAKDFSLNAFPHIEDLIFQAADEGTRLTLMGYREGDDIPIQEIVVPNMEFYKM